MRYLNLLIFFLFAGITVTSSAQPKSGDVYKEYSWTNTKGDCGGTLRVGGDLGYRKTKMVKGYQGDGSILFDQEVSLKNAIRAELMVEKMLCHGRTTGLRIQFNDKDWITIKESDYIPSPQTDYAYSANLVTPVALDQLKKGQKNTFKFQVDTADHWWPQNLVYGMILRVYYDVDIKSPKIFEPTKGEKLSENVEVKLSSSNENISKVDFIAHYEGVNFRGDGNYHQWQYQYHKAKINHHIGTATTAPYSVNWETGWIPDQKEKMKLAALIHYQNGYIQFSDVVEGLTLDREHISVELCKPYDVPMTWFTRKSAFQQKVELKGDIEKAVEAKMIFRSWSPGYLNGVYVNDFVALTRKGPKYDYYVVEEALDETVMLKKGENIIKTALTPKYNGHGVHGAEILWPGIMFLVKYDNTKKSAH